MQYLPIVGINIRELLHRNKDRGLASLASLRMLAPKPIIVHLATLKAFNGHPLSPYTVQNFYYTARDSIPPRKNRMARGDRMSGDRYHICEAFLRGVECSGCLYQAVRVVRISIPPNAVHLGRFDIPP